MFDECRKLGVKAVPVTGVNRSHKYQNAVMRAIQQDGRGVCVRVERELCHFPTSLARRLQDLIMTLDVRRDEVDVITDLGSIVSENVNELRMAVTSLISELPYTNDWRSISLAATAMPESVTRDMARLSIKRIERAERGLWTAIAGEHDLPRIPSFCDYGVTHPNYFDEDPREVTFGGKIRYTAGDAWVIVKGQKLEGAGDQFHKLAQMLILEPEFCTSDFSWGDDSIAKCATLETGPGRLQDWIAFTTNHHLRFVTHQLANGP